MLYFAYGSNLNKAQMLKRCPDATALGKMVLPNARLIFRGVADVEYDDTASVQGGLWHITRKCEKALDSYEGYRRDGDGLYRKEYVTIRRRVTVRQKGGGKRRKRKHAGDREAVPRPWPPRPDGQ